MSLCTVPISIPRCDAPPFISAASSSAASISKQQMVGLKSAPTDSFRDFPIARVSGLFLQSPGSRARFRRACTVPLGTKNSVAELESLEDDDDDWEFEFFESFQRPTGRFWRKGGDEEEEACISKREEEAFVDWSAKARERAIKAVLERELPIGSLLEDGKKKKKRNKKKKKKKSPALDGRILKAKLEKLEKLEKTTRGLDENGLLTTDDRVQALMENPLLKTLGSGGGFQGLGNYWDSLANNTVGEIRLAGAAGVENGVLKARGSSNRIVTPTPHKVLPSGPQVNLVTSRPKRQEDFDLNRKLVEAADASEVLMLVRDVFEFKAWGQDESPLSAFNACTALHRIGKHMESVSMPKSDRLSFARNKGMAQLVSAAIESLPLCSAQGISNISWALSKVGGYSLYWTEMDLLAETALRNISDLEPQHIANIAGALASMQHSNPLLFAALDHRASIHHRNFRSQELAQLLWAFSTLNQPAKLLLDSLDSECRSTEYRIEERLQTTGTQVAAADEDNMLSSYLSDSFLTPQELETKEAVGEKTEVTSRLGSNPEDQVLNPLSKQPSKSVQAKEYFGNFSLSQLASLAWSYTVLGQLERPSFAHIWHAILGQGLGTTIQVKDLPCPSLQLSQLYQTKLSLQLEYPELGFSLNQLLEDIACQEWENVKRCTKSISVTQTDVDRLLVGTGRSWVAEYMATDYSLDAALVEEKIGLEIDGPSHFARNTGAPLGHTMLKRRQLAAAGWTVLSIPYQEWDDQQGEQEQALYLYNVLKTYL